MRKPRFSFKTRRSALTLIFSFAGLSLMLSLTPAAAPVRQAAEPVISTAASTIVNAQPGLYPVTHVTDGDTFNVKTPTGEETVRMIGVDTPETKDPRKTVQCFGETASAHSKSILTGAKVRLEPDPTDTDRDKYGRLLRYVYLADGTLYNAALIQDGYAFAYTVFPLTKLEQFRALEREARAAGRGLWSACAVNESQTIKQTISAK